MEVSRCSHAKQWHRNVQKKCAARAKLLFLLISPVVVFQHSLVLPSPLSITRFYILFEQTINIIKRFAFSPGNSDQQQFSPNNIYTLSTDKVMRINKMITKGKMP